ncbi:MAG: hypothetical protein K8R54_05610 [Bacteroidales bacterium]|nr:hypothetical protein [Bacteroidales bacterium]
MNKTRLILTMLIAVMISFTACKKDDDKNGTFSENEQNGSFATANELLISELYDAKINPAQDQDYFFINASSDLTITVDGDSNLELYPYVYDENKVQIFGGDTGARGASLTHTIKSSEYNGKIYIMIESAYPDDTGNYTIRIN